MHNDIVTALNSVRANLSLYNTSPSIDYEIKQDFIAVVEYIKLYLIANKDRFYGYFLINLNTVIDFNCHCGAGISLATKPFDLIVNPLILAKLQIKEIIYIICHEIEHVIFDHITETMRLNPNKIPSTGLLINIACDAAVNERLNYEIKEGMRIISEPKGLVTAYVIGEIFNLKDVKKLENYLYYYNLLKEKVVTKTAILQISIYMSVRGKDENESSFNNENIKDGTGDSKLRDVQEKSLSIDDAKNKQLMEREHDWDLGGDPSDVHQMIVEYVRDVYTSIDEKTRGELPAYIEQQIRKMLTVPKLNWQQLLKQYIGTLAVPYRKTKLRLNRRQPERFDLCGRVNKLIIKIVVAIDTSGSMNEKDVQDVFAEIFGIIGTRKHQITVIECDAKIQKVYIVKSKGDIDFEVRGRGGTSFTPVIEYINNDRQYRDHILIYFTDGFGEGTIPKPRTYRNLWVVTKNYKLSVQNPYGRVVNIG